MFKSYFFLLTILFSVSPIFSQTGEYCLKLVNKSNPENIRYIYEGKRISLNDKYKNKSTGNLKLENDSIVMILDAAYLLNDITTVRGKSAGVLVANVFGGVLGTFGLMMVGIGGTILINTSSDDEFSNIILIPLGLVATSLGVLATLSGISLCFINGKKYDLEDQWNLFIIPLAEAPSRK